MKKPVQYLMSLFVGTMVLFNVTFAQQSLTTINGWNAYVHLPSTYNSTTKSYPTIVFFPGLGEVGTTASKVIAHGPGAYISQGWNGNVTVDGGTVEFIVISIQPSSAYPNEYLTNQALQSIKSLYRVDPNRLHLTGLSHGGWVSSTFVSGDPYGGPYNYAAQIASVVTVQGMRPDDNQPYPALFDNFANSNGRYLGFEQRLDGRDTKTVVDRMNATKANSAIYVQTNFGSGGHCCWAEFYGGGGMQPGVFTLDGINQNLYQWMARQSRGGTVLPPANLAPSANAGSDKIITLPASSITLTGSGSDPDGSISSYLWTKVSGPSYGTLSGATTSALSISGLAQGTYEYELKVTDNQGATATDRVIVTVNPGVVSNVAPSANAGTDKSITLPTNSVSLQGSGSDPDGSIASYQWSKISGPASGTFSSQTSASVTFSNLSEGTYQVQLKVTDNGGLTATDLVQIVVNPQPVSTSTGSKTVRVNIFNGSTPYTNAQWNNWNPSSISAAFKYDDGATSGVKASLSGQDRIVDNGQNYGTGATVVPKEVLRYNSAHTSNRTLAITGLSSAKTYTLEFYASRKTSGNSTVFTIGSTSKTIVTDNNLNNIAKFTGIYPDNTGKINVELSRIGTWNYLAGFIVAEEGAAVATTVTVNAGADQSITLPANSITLAGTGSGSAGGTLTYTWSKLSGGSAVFSSTSSSTTTVSSLTEGTYQFQLTARDASGTTSSDIVQVIVNPATDSTVISKKINVNVFNGTTAFVNNEWNNWNPSSASPSFLYSDGSTSVIGASITSSAMIVDNGNNYSTSATSSPFQVIRYNSANTSYRTFTLRGLDPAKQYSVTFFASRASTGNSTKFETAGISRIINTDFNINATADFTGLTPDNTGKIEVILSSVTSWNYLAGFTITEAASGSFSLRDDQTIMSGNDVSVTDGSVSVYPSEFVSKVRVEINNNLPENYEVTIKDISDKIFITQKGTKNTSPLVLDINTTSLPVGNYTLVVTHGNTVSSYPVKKIMPVGIDY